MSAVAMLVACGDDIAMARAAEHFASQLQPLRSFS